MWQWTILVFIVKLHFPIGMTRINKLPLDNGLHNFLGLGDVSLVHEDGHSFRVRLILFALVKGKN